MSLSLFSDFGTFDLFGPLPSPKIATPEFLERIGLEPAPFQKWVRRIPDDRVTSSEWPGVVRWYVEHHSRKFDPFESCESGESGEEIRELLDYGLTRKMGEEILENAGENYRMLLPEQYITSWVEDRLVKEVRKLQAKP